MNGTERLRAAVLAALAPLVLGVAALLLTARAYADWSSGLRVRGKVLDVAIGRSVRPAAFGGFQVVTTYQFRRPGGVALDTAVEYGSRRALLRSALSDQARYPAGAELNVRILRRGELASSIRYRVPWLALFSGVVLCAIAAAVFLHHLRANDGSFIPKGEPPGSLDERKHATMGLTMALLGSVLILAGPALQWMQLEGLTRVRPAWLALTIDTVDARYRLVAAYRFQANGREWRSSRVSSLGMSRPPTYKRRRDAEVAAEALRANGGGPVTYLSADPRFSFLRNDFDASSLFLALWVAGLGAFLFLAIHLEHWVRVRRSRSRAQS